MYADHFFFESQLQIFGFVVLFLYVLVEIKFDILFSLDIGKPVLMLEEQYRMHPEIASFPSQHVYSSRLKSHRLDPLKWFCSVGCLANNPQSFVTEQQ